MLLATTAFALLAAATANQAAETSCSSSLTTVCVTKVTPWTLFASSGRPLTDVRLILQDSAHTDSSATAESEGDDARQQGEQMAAVMSLNGMATHYGGHVQRRADAAGLAEAAGASHLLILVPTGAHGNDGSVYYVALLYEKDRLAQPVFQSSVRLGKHLPWRGRDISTTELVNAFADAGLLDAAHHVIAPIHLFGS